MKQVVLGVVLLIIIGYTAKAVDLPLSKADLISSGALVEKSYIYDNKVILFKGEVIGDVMVRGDHAWINVNDDPYSQRSGKLAGYNSGQSVWCKAEDVKMVKTAGDYFHIGDRIEIEGIFHRACQEHGGDMDIHATKINLIEPGRKIEYPFEVWKPLVIAFLFLGTVVLFLMLKTKRRD